MKKNITLLILVIAAMCFSACSSSVSNIPSITMDGATTTSVSVTSAVDETTKTSEPSDNENISEPKVMLLILHETFAFDYWQEAKVIDAEGYCYSVQSNKVSESVHLSEDAWYDKLIKMTQTENVFQLTGEKLETISKFAGKFGEYKSYPVKEYRSDYNDYGTESLYGIYIDENNVPQYILLSKYGDAISCIDNKDIVGFVNGMDSRVFFTDRFKY